MTTEVETTRAGAGWIEQTADLEEFCRSGGAGGWSGVELPFELADAGLACGRNDTGLSILALRASCTEVKVSAAKTQVLEMLELGRTLGVRSLNLTLQLAQLGAECAGYGRYRAALNFCFELLAVSYSEAEATGVTWRSRCRPRRRCTRRWSWRSCSMPCQPRPSAFAWKTPGSRARTPCRIGLPL